MTPTPTDQRALVERLNIIVGELEGLPHVVQTCREAAARIEALQAELAGVREALENIAASAPLLRPKSFPQTYKGGFDAASCWSSDVAARALAAEQRGGGR